MVVPRTSLPLLPLLSDTGTLGRIVSMPRPEPAPVLDVTANTEPRRHELMTIERRSRICCAIAVGNP